MKEKSVEKNYIYNLSYQMLVVIIPLITTPYVSRVLTAEGVGAFSYTTAMVSYFALVGNLGVATYGQLKIAGSRSNKEQMSKIFYELTILRTILMAATMAVYFVFVFVISKDVYRSLYSILVIQIVAALIDISWLLQGMEEFKKLVIRNTLIKLVSTALIFAFVKSPSDLALYAIIMNGSTLLGNLSIWLFLPKYLTKFTFSGMHPFEHFMPCVTYFIPTVATAIYLTLDKTMIGWFATTSSENGFYEQAHKIEQMAVTVVTSLSIVTMPRMAYLFQNNELEKLRDRLEQTIKFILLVSIPMCFGMAAVSDSFIPLYLGEGYEKSIVLLKIFSLLMVVVGLNNAVGKQVLMPTGRQSKYNKAVIIGAFTNFALNLLLIPRLYSVGAAIASVAAETVILILFTLDSRDFVTGRWMLRSSLKYIVSGIVMFVLIRCSYRFLEVSWMHLIVQIIIGIIAYFAVVFILRDRFAIDGVKKIISKIKR